MKFLFPFLISVLMIPFCGFSQDITAFADANNRLYKFDKGKISQIYYQPTREIHIGNQYVCFVDNKGDVFVDFYGQKSMVAQTHNAIYDTDNILLVQTASVLRVFDQGVKHILTSNAMTFAYGDSLVVWQDFIGGYLKYYYKDEIHEVAMVVGDYPLQQTHVGSNTFVYKDNAGNVSAFWQGKFYPLYSSNLTAGYYAGQDVVAFNDPRSGTFAAFDNGYVVDVEEQHALGFRCGDNFIYYKDAGENHMVYREEEKMELGFDLLQVDVRDSLIIYKEFEGQNSMKIWYQMEIYQIYNTNVKNYQADGGIVAYNNQWGGVSAFVRGEEIEITRSKVQSFELHGNTIKMKMGPSSYWVWWNGTIYEF